MIDKGKFIKIFCVLDVFCKNFAFECEKNLCLEDKEYCHHNCRDRLSYGENKAIEI